MPLANFSFTKLHLDFCIVHIFSYVCHIVSYLRVLLLTVSYKTVYHNAILIHNKRLRRISEVLTYKKEMEKHLRRRPAIVKPDEVFDYYEVDEADLQEDAE